MRKRLPPSFSLWGICLSLAMLGCAMVLPAFGAEAGVASLHDKGQQPSESPKDDTATPPKSELDSSLTVALWSSRISAPDPGEDAETRLALRRLIRQVRSITFADKDAAPVPSAPLAEPPRGTEPTAPPAPSVEKIKPAPPISGPAPMARATSSLSLRAQKTLEGLRQNAAQIRDSLEAAELLFLSGRLAEAVPFYEESLRRVKANDPTAAGDRAWILFQLGNCLRETNAAKAQETYAKLIAEYPDSPWTEIARADRSLLTWYQGAQPGQLMAPTQH